MLPKISKSSSLEKANVDGLTRSLFSSSTLMAFIFSNLRPLITKNYPSASFLNPASNLWLCEYVSFSKFAVKFLVEVYLYYCGGTEKVKIMKREKKNNELCIFIIVFIDIYISNLLFFIMHYYKIDWLYIVNQY